MKTLATLLAISALSGYQTSKATDSNDFSEALVSTSSVRTSYNEVLQETGIAPQSLNELGLDEHYFKSEFIEHIDIDPQSGSIMLGLAPSFGQNQWVALIPTIENYGISSWTCQSTVSETLALNSGCSANIQSDHLTTLINAELFDLTLIATSSVKLNAAEIYTTELRFPQRFEELGVDQRWLNTAYVDHVVVEPKTKSILFGLNGAFGSNEWLVVTASKNRNGGVNWHCKTTLPRSMVNSRACFVSVNIENLLR